MSRPPRPCPPAFGQDGWCSDGWRYRWTPYGHALRVRHATFWSALWNAGLGEALTPRAERYLEGCSTIHGWQALHDYTGVTGEISFEGPMSCDDFRLMLEAAGRAKTQGAGR